MNMLLQLNEVMSAYALVGAQPTNEDNAAFWEVRDAFMAEVQRLQAVEQTYLTRQENSKFTWESEVFVGYGTYNSAYATYLIWDHVDFEDTVLDILLEAGRPQTEDDFLAIAMTLKDRITSLYIFPEGADDVANPNVLQQDMIESMADEVDWKELAKKWNSWMNWEGCNESDAED
jgi:hypothetical protein